MTDNLLLDPLIRVRRNGTTQALSLPEVLAALAADEVDDFPALRPHQRHPWHAFLCQLAVMAAEEGGEDRLDLSPGRWRELLRRLTPGFPEDEPWRLCVADLSRPAFLQPPVPEGTLNDFTGMGKLDKTSALSLDVLVCANAHGEKAKTDIRGHLEQWIFGLFIVQTFSGQLGAPNYGIARQNGGFAARPGVSLTFSSRFGPRWRRDCSVLLAEKERLRIPQVYPPAGGERLLWLLRWTGGKNESLPLSRLHPLCIETARRLRLVRMANGRLRCHAKGTAARRIAAEAYRGAVGDPWIPTDLTDKTPKALNRKPHYTTAHAVLFDRKLYTPALLQEYRPDEPKEGAAVLFRIFQRTQGGSDGYHERAIPVPATCVGFLSTRTEDAAQTARNMAELARAARNRVLKPALLQLMQAGREQIEFQQPETNDWASRLARKLDKDIDASFFPILWTCLERLDADEEAEDPVPWREYLIEAVRRHFAAGAEGLPLHSGLRYRARATAENMLEGAIRKHLSIQE